MPYRILERGFHHIYNRGFEKQTIFHSYADYQRFLTRCEYLLSDRYRETIQLHAFCLLPNHFHFVLSGAEDQIPLFLRDLQNSYAKYYNMLYQHRGTLFEGRYCERLLADEEYLANCMSYVCYNAIKHELVTDIREWPWTSYHELLNPGVQDASTPGLLPAHLPRVTPLEGVEMIGGYVDIDEE